MQLSDYEWKVLAEANGEIQDDLRWGAAMGATIEFLAQVGLVTFSGEITQKGKRILEEHRNSR